MAALSPATGVNEIVDEVTLMELYSPPFEAAVKTSTGVMCACTTLRDVAHMPARHDACSLPFGIMSRGRSGWFAVCPWHGLVLCLCHTADNRINGVWACENRQTLKDMLKGPTPSALARDADAAHRTYAPALCAAPTAAPADCAGTER